MSRSGPAVAAAPPGAGDLVEAWLTRAWAVGASDLHLEPESGRLRVRARVDGVLREWAPAPLVLADPVLARLKLLAGLNVTERRLPQDGRLRPPGRAEGWIRLATLPGSEGESAVLRLLRADGPGRTLAGLDAPPEVEAGLRRALARPWGLLVVAGPTGCGKTTTLYALLRELLDPGRKIVMVEDPIEYEVEGVLQAQADPERGFSFADCLRAFLRHDPDVILVGEIRDGESAETALQAGLTGHLVLTTLHAAAALPALARMADLGLDRSLLAATLLGVLSQRLLRLREPPAVAPMDVGRDRLAPAGADRPEPGRRAVFEFWTPGAAAAVCLARGLAPEEWPASALPEGFRTLREEACRLAAEGLVDPAEALRSTPAPVVFAP